MSSFRIMHVSANQYPPLPAQHHTYNIWKELAINCDQYHIFARSLNFSFSTSQDFNIRMHLIPSFGKRQFPFFFLSFLLPYYCWKYKPTHLIIQCPVLGGLAGVVCKKLFNVKLFVEIHMDHYFAPVKNGLIGTIHHKFFKFFSKITFKRADKIRSLSSEMSQFITDIYDTDLKSKIIVIPNRVNLKTFNSPKDSYQIDKILKVVTIGSFAVVKNHIQLIRDLNSSNMDFHLTIIGSGSLKKDYLTLACELKIQEKISILENLDHSTLAKILPTKDIYIHYSLSEGVPRAILEAMAVGLPVIATKAGYIKDSLINEYNSILLDLAQLSELQEALLKCSSQEFRQRLGINARKTIEEKHEWSHVFNLYRKSIENC